MATAGTQGDPTFVRGVTATGASAPSGASSDDAPYTKDALFATSDLTGVVVNFNATTEQTLIAGAAGQTIRVHRCRLYTAGATNLTIRSSLAGATLEVIQFPGAGNYILDFSERPLWATVSGGAFTVQSSAAVQFTGRIEYVRS